MAGGVLRSAGSNRGGRFVFAVEGLAGVGVVFGFDGFARVGIELGVCREGGAGFLGRKGGLGRLVAGFLDFVLNAFEALLKFYNSLAKAAADFGQTLAKEKQT